MTTEDPHPEAEWKLVKPLFSGETNPDLIQYLLSSREHTRTYKINRRQMPAILQKRLAGTSTKVYFRGRVDGVANLILGPVEVLEGRTW